LKLLAKYKDYTSVALLLVYGVFFYLMLQLTLQYIPLKPDVAFLRIKQNEVLNVKGYLSVFYIHVYSSLFVLVAGFTQFSKSILKKSKQIHRAFGWMYFAVVLLLSAPSGIFMGFCANGAWHTKLSFILLGTLWIVFTLQALIAIKSKQIKVHQNYMLRSFALALSAVTLRSWKVLIVACFDTAPIDTYKIIAWLGWVPNLLIAEYLINKKR
jgi:uncharacterized membrane protein